MIGIISALNEELMEIIDKIETKKVVKGFTFYLANIYDKDVVLGICGVGKVNSAMYTQSMIDNFSNRYLSCFCRKKRVSIIPLLHPF